MNLQRLPLAGDDQGIFPRFNQIFGTLRNPLFIRARNGIKSRAASAQWKNAIESNRFCHHLNQIRRHPQPVIRACASQRKQRFHRIKPTHPLARLTSGGEFTDVIVRVVFATEKIAI